MGFLLVCPITAVIHPQVATVGIVGCMLKRISVHIVHQTLYFTSIGSKYQIGKRIIKTKVPHHSNKADPFIDPE